MEASCAGRLPNVVPVKISCFNNILKLNSCNDGSSAGYVVSEALARLIKDYSVILTGTLIAQNAKQLKKSGIRLDIQVRSLRVIVYGIKAQKDAVADILDQSSLFLQRPEVSEYDRRVRYLNPMYFIRPGEDAPRLLGFSTSPGTGELAVSNAQDRLDEVGKSRVLSIFDHPQELDPGVARDIEQSPRVKSVLKEYVFNISLFLLR